MSPRWEEWCGLAHMVISACGILALLLLVMVLGTEEWRWRSRLNQSRRALPGPPRRRRHTRR